MSQEVDASGLAWVLDRPAFPTLKDLNLVDNAIDFAGLEVIQTHPKTQDLEMLDLSLNPLGDEGVRRLARWPGLEPVDWLGLNAVGMTSSGVAALAEAAQEFSWLTLGNNRLGPASTDSLCLLAPGVLVVEDSGLDARSAVRLVSTTRAAALDLGQNPIGDDLDGLEALAVGLRSLDLSRCGLGPHAAKGLAAARAPSLRSLILEDPLLDEGVIALSGAAWIGQLTALVASQTRASETALNKLRTAFRGGKNIRLG